jgi:hypothetical protein
MKQFRWFFAWQDEEEEKWLREMALMGWHFQSVQLPGFYTFENGAPRDDVYRLDYLANTRDKAGYLQLFLDAGWSYLGEMNNWQYFRKPVENGVLPEIYTDNESKAKKYQRLMLVLVIILPLFTNMGRILSKTHSLGMQIILGVYFLLLLFYIYSILMLLRRVRQLKKKL